LKPLKRDTGQRRDDDGSVCVTAILSRIARRRVKVCAAIHLDLDAPSTVR
jgi:hypothetical protein